ncbi:MAG: Rv2175c family DNA-binding protein [Actinomycetes bacterium]
MSQQQAGSDDLDDVISDWLSLPDVAAHLGTTLSRVRRMLDDRLLVAVRRGSPKVASVPRALVDPEPLPELPGTLSVLMDSGFDLDEALRWLFTPDPSLPGTPLENLRAGRKTEVRRRAQALAF